MELTVACCVAGAGHVVVPESTSLVGIEFGSTLTANDGERSAARKRKTSSLPMFELLCTNSKALEITCRRILLALNRCTEMFQPLLLNYIA